MSTALMFTVREATPAETPCLIEMIQAMAQESEGRALQRAVLTQGVQRVFDCPALGTYWVVVEKATGRCIGSTLITIEWSDWNNAPYWWFQSVYLHPKFRGQGLIEFLFLHIEQKAQAAGAHELRLYVEHENQRAIRAYEKQGLHGGHYDMMSKRL